MQSAQLQALQQAQLEYIMTTLREQPTLSSTVLGVLHNQGPGVTSEWFLECVRKFNKIRGNRITEILEFVEPTLRGSLMNSIPHFKQTIVEFLFLHWMSETTPPSPSARRMPSSIGP